jgi:hypothetical protein
VRVKAPRTQVSETAAATLGGATRFVGVGASGFGKGVDLPSRSTSTGRWTAQLRCSGRCDDVGEGELSGGEEVFLRGRSLGKRGQQVKLEAMRRGRLGQAGLGGGALALGLYQ